jgi:hypothetical protein
MAVTWGGGIASKGVSGYNFYVKSFSLPSFQSMLYTVFIVQAYQTSQYVVLSGSIFLGKQRSSFAGSSDSKMNVQSACTLNTRYKKPKQRSETI